VQRVSNCSRLSDIGTNSGVGHRAVSSSLWHSDARAQTGAHRVCRSRWSLLGHGVRLTRGRR
jgi:hypothetical protein